MRVNGHCVHCDCHWCQDRNTYLRMPNGEVINFTEHCQGKNPRENIPPSILDRIPGKPISQGTPVLVKPPKRGQT